MTRFLAFSGALFATVFLATEACGADTIYQSTDKRGNPVFTDQPQPDARPVELPPINTTPSVSPTALPDSSSTNTPFAGYRKIRVGVTSSIPNGLAPTTIGIELQPELQPGHRWQLLLDGAIQQEGGGSSATIDRLERGTHTFELRVLDAYGTVIGTSPRQEAFVFWPGGKNN